MLLYLSTFALSAVAEDRSDVGNTSAVSSVAVGVAPRDHVLQAQATTFGNGISAQPVRECVWPDAPPGLAGGCFEPANEGDIQYLRFISETGPARFERVFRYWTVDGTARDGADYTGGSGTLTMAVGATTTQRALFPILQDVIDEEEEYFVFRYVSTEPAIHNPSNDYGVVPIADDDDPPTVSIMDESVREDAGDMEFDLTLSAESGKTITVDFATSDGTAHAPDDYASASGTVTFAPGDTAATVAVSIVDDGVDEQDEEFTVTLSNGTNVTVDDGTATGTIIDTGTDPAARVADASVLENGGDLEFVVTVSPRDAEATLAYATSDGTATAGSDYTSQTGTLTFAPAATTMTVTVPVSGDTDVEPDETLTLTISQGNDQLRIRNAAAMGTIRNDDFELAIVATREGPEGGRLVFPVTLNGDGVGRATITADYQTTALTATEDVDYDGESGTLSFPAGTSVRSITVNVRQDTLGEASEQFEVTLSNESGAVVTNRTSTATILDDDQPTIMVDDATAAEGAGTLGFPVNLSGRSTVEVTVEFATDFNTAVAEEDYIHREGTLTFAPGETRKTIDVTLVDDVVDEDDENFLLKLRRGVNATVPVEDKLLECPFADFDACAFGTIEDDDENPTLSVADAEAAEADGELAFVVTVSNLDEADVEATVDYATTDGTATAPGDYVAAAGTLTFTSTETVRSVVVTVVDDRLDEPAETLTLILSGPANAILHDAEASGTIEDDDEASTAILLTADPPRVREGDGATDVTVTATLDASARTRATTVAVTVAAGDDADAVDFAEVPDFTITIAAGQASGVGTFTLTPDDDMVDETDETVGVEGTSDLPVTGTTVQLADDDEPSTTIELSADPVRATEDGGAVQVAITATLDGGAATAARTVAVTVAGSGEEHAVDFDPVPAFSITIAAEETTATGTFTLTPMDDLVDEIDETLAVEGTSDLPVSGATVTLADDDEPPTAILLSAVPERISEGGGPREVAVTAAFDQSARADGTEVVVTVAGTVADAVGFAAVPAGFTITIEAEAISGSATFSVTPEDDEVAENDETLAVSGTADLPVTGTTVTLADDDAPSTHVLLSALPATVTEGAGATRVEVTAELNAASRLVETVVAVTVTGSGVADAVDFEEVDGFTLTIDAGMPSGKGAFTLVPEADDIAESSETLAVEGSSDLPVTDTSVTLVDDDDPSTGVVLSATPPRVTEGGGAVEVEVTAALDGAARQQATLVTVSVTGSGAADTVDFATVDDFTVTIAAGAPSGEGSFTLVPVDDQVAEEDETLTVSGASDLPVTSATVVVADDDEAPTVVVLVATPGRVSEGGGPVAVGVTATLDRGRRASPTTVEVSVAGGGDPAAVDFAPVSGFTVVIPAGAAVGEGSFTLVPEADAVVEIDETLTVSGVSDLPVMPDTVALVDDDEPSTRIVLAASPARVSEGAGPTAVAVTATLDRGLRRTATVVAVSVAGSGDPAAADFDPVADFALTIAAGSARGTGTFTLTPQDDDLVELDHTLAVTGTSDLPVTPTSVVLADDDEVSTRILLFLSVDPAQASEGAGPVEVTVTAAVDKAARPEATRIDVTVAGSGDPLAVDFAPVDGFEIVIPANALDGTAVFTVRPENDRVVERDETVTVAGTSDLPVTPATLTLLDDDEVALVLTAEPAELSEDGGPVEVAVTATLTGGVRQVETAVTVSVLASGHPDAVDFAPVADFSVTVPAGASHGEGSFTLTPNDDREDERDETVAIAGVSDVPVTPTSVIIRDDERSGPPTLTVADATAVEGDGELAFTLDLDAPADTEVTVRYTTADGTAEAGADYQGVVGTLAFAPGEVSGTVRVVVANDVLDEPDETLRLDLSVPRNAILARPSAAGTIIDDDEPPDLSIADASGSEGDGELRFAVTLTAPGIREVTVRYATADGTAEAGMDYRTAEGILTLAVGETAATIRVVLLDDALDEADAETFTVALSGFTGGAVPGDVSATGTILDDDAPPELAVMDAAGDEAAGPLAFVIALDAPSAVEATVDYATRDVTATAGSDYEAVSGTLAFAPGVMSRTVAVPLVDDDAHEPDETFVLDLSVPRNTTLGDGSATGTILDDDLSPPSLAGALPDAALCVGGVPFELDLAEHFHGEEIVFSTSSSAPGVATATLSGSRLAIAPVAEGAAEVSVTASNAAGMAEGVVRVRVVTDPAELAAVDTLLAAIGRGVLLGVADTVGDRVALRDDAAGRDSMSDPSGTADGTSAFGGTRPVAGTGTFGAAPASPAFPGEQRPPIFVPGEPGRTPTLSGRHHGARGALSRAMAPFSFSLAAPAGDDTGPAWSVWGRGEQRRFEGGVAGASHDGTLTGVSVGVDVGGDDWLAGVGLLHSRAEADYRFARSVEACGGGPGGEGLLDTELTAVNPYGGRRVGRGWLWAALGTGRGDVSLERCGSGQAIDTDLTMRLAAVGGRHPFAGGERTSISVIEDLGVVELVTGTAAAPLGDRAVTAGHLRIGLEAAGVAPPGCECSLATYVRAYARHDWGDGVTGTGLELAAGVRYENAPRRLGVDVGVRALAAHSSEDAEEHAAHLAVTLLPAADGSGWRAALALRRDLGPSGSLGGISPWSAPTGRWNPSQDWTGQLRFGYGFANRRGTAVPFLELDAADWSWGQSRLGVRHELADGVRAVQIEWGFERTDLHAGTSHTSWIVVISGRF